MEYCTLGAYMHIHTFKVVKCGLVLFSLVPSGLPGLTGALLCKQTVNSFFCYCIVVVVVMATTTTTTTANQLQDKVNLLITEKHLRISLWFLNDTGLEKSGMLHT